MVIAAPINYAPVKYYLGTTHVKEVIDFVL